MNNNAKILGIVALVVSVLAIFIPLVTIYVIAASLILATIAALIGDKLFVVLAVLVNVFNLIFFSPLTASVFVAAWKFGFYGKLVLPALLFLAPIAVLIVKAQAKPKLADERSPSV